jgi:hypothetical protein
MVKSSSISASLIHDRLFDQSIVGVFPLDSEMIKYLLGFFNSPTCNILINIINPTANNSANYIKKIPLLSPSPNQKSRIDNLVEDLIRSSAKNSDSAPEIETELHHIVSEIYGF